MFRTFERFLLQLRAFVPSSVEIDDYWPFNFFVFAPFYERTTYSTSSISWVQQKILRSSRFRGLEQFQNDQNIGAFIFRSLI